MRSLLSCYCCLLLLTVCQAQAQNSSRYTISGYVRETGSHEALLGATVRVVGQPVGTQSNTFGFYSITLPETDSVSLVFSLVGYQPESVTLPLQSAHTLTVELMAGEHLREIIVHGDRQHERVSETAQMSQIDVPIAQLKKVPALMGERDVLRVLQLMPGVQKGSEGQAGLYVRGGGPDQNLILLDDAVVYNASHLFGFFSVFNGDALKSVELTKGGFPARYGGRLSSVIDLTMKDGSRDKLHGEVGIGAIAGRIMLEGPLGKPKDGSRAPASFLISARRTYLDAIAAPLIRRRSNGENTAGYYFYDLNAKINYDLGPKDKLYLSGYFGRDRFDAANNLDDTSIGLGWGNATATLRWNHQFSQKLFSNTSLIFSDYGFRINSDQLVGEQSRFRLDYQSGIRDHAIKYDVDYYPIPHHAFKFGLRVISHRFTPSAIVLENQALASIRREVDQINALNTAMYAEDTWQPNDHWRINAGLRVSSFFTGQINYVQPEPRLSTAYLFGEHWAAKASYAQMNQYLHLLSNTGVGLPTDLWVPSTDRVRPQRSQQWAVGLAKDLPHSSLAITVEGYYKRMNNIINYKEGASFLLVNDPGSAQEVRWEDNITSGRGWSYGGEVLIHKKEGRLSGWIGYTWSRTQWQFPEINDGRPFFPRYDRRHDISVVGMYDFTPHLTVSATWVYGTGEALTIPNSRYRSYGLGNSLDLIRDSRNNIVGVKPRAFEPDLGVRDFGESKNSFRAEAYHRLDLSVQLHRRRRQHQSTWEFSVYNAYNRQNPFFYNIESVRAAPDKPSTSVLYKYSIFPVVPSINYTYKF